jgi:hypothetical protein
MASEENAYIPKPAIEDLNTLLKSQPKLNENPIKYYFSQTA